MAVEGYRFGRLFVRVVSKLDAGEASRYVNQLRYFQKRLEDNLAQAGLNLVNLEGHAYDSGMAVTALNVGDFGPDDQLIIDHMVEPVIMGPDGLRRAGIVMLKKVSQ
jgi:hypothetical protein